MATARISAGNFTLSSTWKARMNGNGNYEMEIEPTVASHVVNFGYSLPSGATIRMACVRATVSAPGSGISILTVNGASMFPLSGSIRNANVALSGNRGTLAAKFVFKTGGELVDALEHTATISFSNVHMLIEYDPPVPVDQLIPADLDGLSIPPQAACMIAGGKVYVFDGVQKVQHTISVKIEEEPDKDDGKSKKKYTYINNARNEVDKVSLDVVMSDVYSGGAFDNAGSGVSYGAAAGYMAEGANSRSTNAYAILHALKESCELVTVVTQQYVYTDMLIESITSTQDENTPFGWSGQISFQGKPEGGETKTDKTASKAKTKNVEKRDPSIYVGKNARTTAQ